MKSTLLIAALMSSVAVAYQAEDLVDTLGSPFGVFDGDDDWEAVEPVRIRTTTTSRPVRPAYTTSSRYSCTTTTSRVPAVATTSSVKPLEWNAVKQYDLSWFRTEAFTNITQSLYYQPIRLYQSYHVCQTICCNYKPFC